MFWRKRQPLHEQLAREGGMTPAEQGPFDTGPRWGEVGIHGIHRQREWDAVATAEAPELAGDEARFVVLVDGSILTETDDLDLDPLADALEGSVEAPYRAEAVRRGDGLWAVAARRVQVVEVPEDVDGDRATLTVRNGERTLEVDGMTAFGSIPTLERLAGDDVVVTAQRLDETLWEVELNRL
ncbi:MAG: hypothetical protein MSC30_12190 [Gaiellaceae bacterium MAG52_C11]|nr:hypothetical protein [Candidatus Gaiellasilicea maunaloa]